jgi:hypothetical protein
MSHFRLDFWRESVENAIAKRTPVTVGIGVLCDARFEDGPAIILAVDDKGVYGDPPETANDVCGKFHDTLPFAALGIAVSGTLSTCDAIVAEFCTQLETTISKRKKKKTKPFLRSDDLRIAIREARRYEYPLYFDDQLQALTGMSREEWLRETNPEKKRKGWVVARAAQLYFPSWIIVGGFIGKDWVLMKSSGATVTEMGAQNFAVGIGELEALKVLNSRHQDAYTSAPRSLLHVAEAMGVARATYPHAIGQPDFMLLRAGKPIMRLKKDSRVLRKWISEFAGKLTRPMQDDRLYRKELESDLYEHRSLNG